MSGVVKMAEFARAQGWRRSYVTKLKNEGRLVLTDDGLVEVEASLARIEETGGGREDVAERWGDHRAGKGASAGSTYQQARTTREQYLALQARAEYERTMGQLCERAEVEAAATEAGATLRHLLERLPDQLTPLLFQITDEEKTRAILIDAIETVLGEVADSLAAIGASRSET